MAWPGVTLRLPDGFMERRVHIGTCATRLISIGIAFAIVASVLPVECSGADVDALQVAPRQWQRTSWRAREGAPMGILALAQTGDGFLWVASAKGLFRFDGVRFEHYTPESGDEMPPGEVSALFALPNNELMIGWHLGGAALLGSGRLTRYAEAEGYPPGTTWEFLRDTSGAIWATTTSGLARFDGRRWEVVGEQWGFPAGQTRVLFLHSDGTLATFKDRTLFTLARGARRFDAARSRWAEMDFAQAHDGTLYVMRPDGVRAVPALDAGEGDAGRVITRDERGAVGKLVVDRRGGLWHFEHRADRMNVVHIEDAHDSRSSSTLIDVYPRALLEDTEGDVWIGSDDGLHRFRRKSFSALGIGATEYPGMLAAADGGLWVSAVHARAGASFLRLVDRDGVLRLETPRWTTCLYRDRNGVDWFGIRGDGNMAEILRHENGRFESIKLAASLKPDYDVLSIAVDSANALWASVVRQGVFRRQNGEWSNPAALPGNGKEPAFFIYSDSKGRVWLSYAGGRVFAWQDGKAQEYSEPFGLGLGNIFTIVESGDHLWFAGEAGLAQLDGGGRFHKLLFADAETSGGIVGLVETAQGDLWMASGSGVVRVNANEVRRALAEPGHRMVHRLFDEDDGVHGQTVRLRPIPGLMAGTDGRVWVATTRGLFHAQPSDLSVNPNPPRVVITGLSVDETKVPLAGDVVLPSHTTSLQIDYGATSLAMPQHVRFRYKLEGVDDHWKEAGARRQAFYTNLGPGTYRFTVLAANEDGVWTPEGRSLAFSIAPAWYQTQWFRLLCVLAAIVLLALAYRLRINQVMVAMRARLEERLMERERIARDLHDTLLQGLQGLTLHFQAVAARIPKNEPTHDMMEEALTLADEVMVESRNRVKDLRASTQMQGDLPAALAAIGQPLAQEQATKFSVAIEGAPRKLHPIVREEAFSIGREALLNAFRHAGARKIEVEVSFKPGDLRVRVRDDGCGIEPDVLESGGRSGHWGLIVMRERASKIKGHVEIWSRKGDGTEIELRVPASMAYSGDAWTGGWRWWRSRFSSGAAQVRSEL
jgi:signal transduction histidine kinase/ligand-binding sensor domain-containing protein